MKEENNNSLSFLNRGYSALKAAYESVGRSFRGENKKIEAETGWQTNGGMAFDARGLMFTEEKKNPDGSVARDRKGNIVYVNREFRKKGFSTRDILNNNSMVLSKPNGAQRVPPQLAMENYTGLNYAMTRAIQDEMAAIEWQLYEIKGDNHEEQFEHELLDLLNGVNEFQTGPELRHVIGGHLELTGNAYLLMLNAKGEPVSSEEEKPTQLHTLNPGKVKVMLDKTIYPWKIIGYEFLIEAKRYLYKPFQILHIKYPNPADPYQGIGTTQSIAEWIDVDNYAMEFNRQYFIHGTYLTGWLETEYTSEDQTESLRESWNEQHAGVQNTNKVAIMPKGVKFHEGATIKDMAFDKLLNTTRDRILAGSRVGHTILGTAESDTNRATAETADYVFAKRTIKPKMILICSFINEFLTPRFGDNIYITFKDPTPEDKQFRIEEMKTATAGQPVISVNEARENYLGLGPVQNGDIVKVPSTMGDIGSPEKEPIGKPKKTMKSDMAVRPAKPRFARNMNVRRAAADAIAKSIMEAIKEIKAKRIWELSTDEYATVHKAAYDRAEQAREKLEKEMIVFNNNQCAEVLKNLAEATKAIDKTKLFDKKKWTNILIDVATPILGELAKEEGMIASEAITGVGINIMEVPEYAEALAESMALLGRTYNETTLDLLEAKLQAGFAEGMSIEQLKDSVQGLYESWNTESRAYQLARTETFRISNNATKEAWKQTGVVKTIKWYTSGLGNECEYCHDMSGKIISIEENFFNEGDSISAGDHTMNLDYGDVEAPPLHPNCGCYIQPETVEVD